MDMENNSVNNPCMLLPCFCCWQKSDNMVGGGLRGAWKMFLWRYYSVRTPLVIWSKLTPSARRNRKIFSK